VAASKRSAGDDDRSDEAWIRTAGGDTSIRVRSLSNYLAKGGALLDARLVENPDGVWSIWLRLADRTGEFRLNHFHSDEPKTYLDLNLAINALREDFGYFGAITLTTDRRPTPKP
jgi:hypothetical protein